MRCATENFKVEKTRLAEIDLMDIDIKPSKM